MSYALEARGLTKRFGARVGDVRQILTDLAGRVPVESGRHQLTVRVDGEDLLPELVHRASSWA